jgi:hypothetical protein
MRQRASTGCGTRWGLRSASIGALSRMRVVPVMLGEQSAEGTRKETATTCDNARTEKDCTLHPTWVTQCHTQSYLQLLEGFCKLLGQHDLHTAAQHNVSLFKDLTLSLAQHIVCMHTCDKPATLLGSMLADLSHTALGCCKSAACEPATSTTTAGGWTN